MKKTAEHVYKNKNIGIVGLGLIGGSIAKRLMSVDKTINIIGVDSDEKTLEYAFMNDIIHLGHTDYRILRGCEIIFIATPMDITGNVIKEVFEIVGNNSLITDTASVKSGIINALPKKIRFIGGHPMAGRESGGIESSLSHLFENAYYIITPDKSINASDIEKLKQIIEKLGSICMETTPEEHDAAVANVSHLPHYISYALVNHAINGGIENKIGATSFRDMTRVASSCPAFWTAAAKLNRDNIIKSTEAFIAELSLIKQMIVDNDYIGLEAHLTSVREKRESISILKAESYSVTVDVPDKPGIIGKITGMLGKKKINIRNIYIRNSREGEAGALVLYFADEVSFNEGRGILEKKFVLH